VRQLEYFTTVAKLGSFRGSAKALGISEPTLSQQLKRLEQECGALLIDRTSHHTAGLTAAGQTFLARAERALAEIEAGLAEVSELSGVSGELRLATALGADRLARFLAAFARQYPRVDLVAHHQSYDGIMRLLTDGHADVGLVQVHPATSPVPPGIAVKHLDAEAIGVLVRADHPLARKKTVAVEDLSGERLILYTPGTPVRAGIELALNQAKLPLDKQPYDTNATSTMGALVEQGLGVGIVGAPSAAVASRGLQFRPFADPNLTLRVAVLWAKRRRGAAAEALIHFAENWAWSGE